MSQHSLRSARTTATSVSAVARALHAAGLNTVLKNTRDGLSVSRGYNDEIVHVQTSLAESTLQEAKLLDAALEALLGTGRYTLVERPSVNHAYITRSA